MSKIFTKEVFWKNFNIGTELDISGIFLFNAMNAFDKIYTFNNSEEIFEILYNFSVGIERLEKIVIILTEYNSVEDKEKFNESIKCHNHVSLMERIRKHHTVNLSKSHNNFLKLLTNFYKTMRYDRYNINVVADYDKEKQAFISFLSTNLDNVEIVDGDINLSKNNNRIKKILGKTVKKITSQLYDIITEESQRLNIYTYEIKYDSKAAKIFLDNNIDFNRDNIFKKEIFYYLISCSEKIMVNGIEPLGFDIANIENYLRALFSNEQYMDVRDEVESLFDEIKNKKRRIEYLENLESIIKCNIDNEIENEQ